MSEHDAWGPLAALIGEWEGNDGLDFSFHNVEGEVGETIRSNWRKTSDSSMRY